MFEAQRLDGTPLKAGDTIVDFRGVKRIFKGVNGDKIVAQQNDFTMEYDIDTFVPRIRLQEV